MANQPPTLSGLHKPGSTGTASLGICIYGAGGVGKTTLLSTMPGRGLVVDVPQIEGGTMVLANVSDRVDVKPVESWDEINDVFWFLKTAQHDYQWVGVDSLTAFSELARRKTIRERDLDADPHTVSMQEWGKIGGLVSELIFRFRTLKQHTIWIAQERKFGADEDVSAKRGPSVSPASLTALVPSMLLMGRLTVERGLDGHWERHLRIGPHPLYHTKVRTVPGVRAPNVIRNPRLDDTIRYLLGLRPEPLDEVDDNSNVIILG